MQINQILAPEVYLGTRGIKEEISVVSVIKKLIVKNLRVPSDEDVNDVISSHVARKAGLSDAEARDMMSGENRPTSSPRIIRTFQLLSTLGAIWDMKGRRTYYFAKEFSAALSRVRPNIQLDFIPEDGCCVYMAFSPNTMFNGLFYITGAFCCITRVDLGSFTVEISYDKNGEIDTMHNAAFEIKNGETMEEGLGRVTAILDETGFSPATKEVVDKELPLASTIMNCLTYIHSLSPAVEDLRPFLSLGKSEKNKIRQSQGHRNLCTIPVKLVNWSYGKGRIYHVDGTWVETFQRWQRCGKDFRDIKLIWVKEHERHYKNTDSAIVNQPPAA